MTGKGPCFHAMQSTLKLCISQLQRQLALDGVVDMDYTSNDAGPSPTYYLLFSSVFFLLLFTTLSYKTAIMYFE